MNTMQTPWREVVIPHSDVLKDAFQQAEFAVDLSIASSPSGQVIADALDIRRVIPVVVNFTVAPTSCFLILKTPALQNFPPFLLSLPVSSEGASSAVIDASGTLSVHFRDASLLSYYGSTVIKNQSVSEASSL